MFYKFKPIDWLYLIILIVLTYLWINYDQLVFSTGTQRMIAFTIFGLVLMVLYFTLVRPNRWVPLANSMCAVLIPFFIILTFLIHLVIRKDEIPIKAIVLWFLTAGMVYLSGSLYNVINKNKK